MFVFRFILIYIAALKIDCITQGLTCQFILPLRNH